MNVSRTTSTIVEVRRRCEARGTGRWSVLLGYATPYAVAAFEAEVERVASAAEGCRNHTLYVAACNISELVNGVELPGWLVLDALAVAAIRNGLPAREVERTIESAIIRTRGKARTTPPPSRGRSA